MLHVIQEGIYILQVRLANGGLFECRHFAEPVPHLKAADKIRPVYHLRAKAFPAPGMALLAMFIEEYLPMHDVRVSSLYFAGEGYRVGARGCHQHCGHRACDNDVRFHKPVMDDDDLPALFYFSGSSAMAIDTDDISWLLSRPDKFPV
jgi:hypothetical protein